jgi:hypothetical protein
LADAVPGVEAAAAPVKAKLGVFVGKDLGLACPKGVGYLEAVSGVGGAELAGLDKERRESGDEQEQGNRVGRSEAEHLVSMVLATSGFGISAVAAIQRGADLRALWVL